MKIVMVIALGLVVAQSATAQVGRRQVSPMANVIAAGDTYLQSIRQDGYDPRPSNDQASGSAKECLKAKATGRTVCHTREEWRRIAATIDTEPR